MTALTMIHCQPVTETGIVSTIFVDVISPKTRTPTPPGRNSYNKKLF